ncbi:NPCBM/NEW2 domain-containing protein [Rubritalea spongiae]|uniref:NPCBM/NEW2 domain-containing protein n=1 Tax=Rubritalea spongiae TaxID=430797 RepID=A0ABW5E3B1_9BACT
MNYLRQIIIIASLSITYVFAGEESDDFKRAVYADATMAPCPAVIAAAPTGEVFVGVDLQGSLGKKVGLGKVVRLVDENADGKADRVTEFAKVDNPRGIVVLGNKVIVLHTTVKDGKYDNQQLSLFEDKDWDGVADGPAKALVTNIGNSKFLQSRGADHCTNNIRYGIDGWIYISVGDFGMVDAEGVDGRKLTMHGGVVRVRPDGTGLEMYMKNTRNVYDVAIDSEMNLFTRENTNDGIGWWTRSSHFIQTGDYGYPSLYTNFPEDMIPAMGEYGAGSGVGALYIEEPQWPVEFKDSVLLADWGHSKIYTHELQPMGATFSNRVKEFMSVSQVTDLDVDGSERLYISAWDGAGYQGNSDKEKPNKGFVTMVAPKGWKYHPFPVLSELSEGKLLELLNTESHTARTYASHELVARGADAEKILSYVQNANNRKSGRIAAIYAYLQIKGVDALTGLEKLLGDAVIREHVIRAMADDAVIAKQANTELIARYLNDSNPRVQAAAVIALGRIGDKRASSVLLPLAASSVEFKKKDRGETVFKTKILSNIGQERPIKVDVENLAQLVLITDQVHHNKYDQAAWLNPIITLKNGKKIDLTEVEPLSVSVDRGILGVNQDCEGNPLSHRGKSVKGIGVHAQAELVYAIPTGAKTFTATGILTQGAKGEGKQKGKVLFAVSEHATKPTETAGYVAANAENPHSVPNPDIILPHLAQKALVALDAEEAVAEAIKSSTGDTYQGALATAKSMHSTKVVEALITKANALSDADQLEVIEVLARLHQKEKSYEGDTWWGTRPKPGGPYYTPVDWAGTSSINAFFSTLLAKQQNQDVIKILKKNKAYVPKFNPRPKASKGPVVKKIGTTAIEDVVLFVSDYKGSAEKGAKIITQVGCAGCHNIDKQGTVKGPDLTKLGKMSFADLSEAILKPGATIAPTWVTLTTSDGTAHIGTIVKEDADEILLHNIAGIPTVVKASDITQRAAGLNMMSLHLTDDLTLPQFGDLLTYIRSLDDSK